MVSAAQEWVKLSTLVQQRGLSAVVPLRAPSVD